DPVLKIDELLRDDGANRVRVRIIGAVVAAAVAGVAGDRLHPTGFKRAIKDIAFLGHGISLSSLGQGRAAPGGAGGAKISVWNNWPSCRSCRSSSTRPISNIPTGRPSIRPHGTLSAGWPV